MTTAVASGTQAASIGTEHSLATDTTAKTYVLVVNAQNMANGDILELRLYTKVLAGSTKRVAFLTALADVQGEPNIYSLPCPADQYCEATLKQTAGTGRSYEWALLSL